VLRRDEAGITHFITVTYWESEQAIRAFAGDALLTAKYYPEDQGFLLEFETARAGISPSLPRQQLPDGVFGINAPLFRGPNHTPVPPGFVPRLAGTGTMG